MDIPRTVALLLAGGAGSRFEGDEHKLLATLDGRPIWVHALTTAVTSGIGDVIVVTGAASLVPPDASIAGVDFVHNPDWADGQMTSLRVGLDAALERGANAVVVGLADQPFVTPAAWSAIAASSSPIAVATYDGVRGNPVRLAATVWDLLPRSGDEGARGLMRMRPALVEEVPCQGSAADIDTQEDLRRWT